MSEEIKGVSISIASLASLASQATALIRASREDGEAQGLICRMGSNPGSGVKASPRGVTITNVNFDGMDLKDFPTAKVEFSRCSFEGCDLEGMTFLNSTSCDFSRANLKAAKFELSESSLWENNFTEADLSGSAFTRSHSTPADKKVLLNDTNFSRAIMDGIAFESVDLLKGLFTDARITSAHFYNSLIYDDGSLEGADFTGTLFEDSTLRGFQKYQGVNFTGVIFKRTTVDFDLAAWRSTPLGQIITLEGATLSGGFRFNHRGVVVGTPTIIDDASQGA